ncbi:MULTISPECIES: hypothetical protein [unclassified Mesorhizobium]|uniref:hypothetical protein n=1 Tax=unclassified Mesorhizobium TaxID=325217 RepID=UPI00333936A1
MSFEIALETVPVELQSNFVSLFFLIVLPDRSAPADVTSVLTTLFFSCATAAVDTAITIAAQTIVNLIVSPLEHRKNVVDCLETPAKAYSRLAGPCSFRLHKIVTTLAAAQVTISD